MESLHSRTHHVIHRREILHNIFQGILIEVGARKMNGAAVGRAPQNIHSAQLCKGLPSQEWLARGQGGV